MKNHKKQKREQHGSKIREALSFLFYMSDILCCAKSDIIALAIVILKPCGFNDILFAIKLA